ncbi:uncharacterized protein OCT59_002936 [Rhizophagus irregularis]|uniref:uncharacterized protein n=1 Tax=Rhizophagus irregularis TaxID=588596 RepID=UPI00333338D5|nr:hypothetical protein OCT59_002936 [Rhizophagus irregularis]
MDKNNNNKKKNTETVEHVDKRRKTDESADELINEALTKILRQNIKILSKLDIIISNQKALENRVSKVEESVDKNNDNNQGNEEYIKKIIKEVAKKYDKWIIFYEKNIASPLLAKHHSARGSLASKVKDIMYVVFKEFNLSTIPAVNTALKESEIHKWKGSPTVKICYSDRICHKTRFNEEFEKISSKDNYSYSDNDEIEASQEAEETNKVVDKAEEVDEVKEEADEAEEVLQEEKENEIREEDEEEGGRIYISSTNEETKERMRRLKKQYKK